MSHVRLPHIEKYANPLSWKEGTLEEAITREEILEREARNIQKKLTWKFVDRFPSHIKDNLEQLPHPQQHISKLPEHSTDIQQRQRKADGTEQPPHD